MARDSVQAAIIYQHATTEADTRIAATLEAALVADDDGQADDDDGPAKSLTPAG